MHSDPAHQARRLAGLASYFEKPGVRAAHGDRLRRARLNPTPEEQDRLREHGRWLYATHASRPDVVARAMSAEARQRAVAGYIEARLGWCPIALRAAYFDLLRSKRLPAAEARRVIEAQIPGTIEHARIEIANRELASRLRHERAREAAF